MSAAAITPTTPSNPVAADRPSRMGRLLDLVRKLIDYGREFAETVRARVGADPDSVQGVFGTIDIAVILARITLGLSRADALEARLLRNARRPDARPARTTASASRTPRVAPPVAQRVAEWEADLAHLPTVEQIAAEVRRRPIGAVIADICRDLGITWRHPLWRELQVAVVRHGGKLVRMVTTMFDRPLPRAAQPDATTPAAPLVPAPASTGPP
jgi:hypothetical protein